MRENAKTLEVVVLSGDLEEKDKSESSRKGEKKEKFSSCSDVHELIFANDIEV